jgi:hypothetical protein
MIARCTYVFLQPPLLLPRRYAARVGELARSRAACAPLMEALRRQLGAPSTISTAATSAPVPLGRTPSAVSSVSTVRAGSVAVATPESLYNPAGRLAFNLRVPADLSHLSDDVVRQAIRVQVEFARSLVPRR